MSRATVIVPAQVPKRRTEAKTKVSETDRRAGSFGTLTVNEPLKRVSAASGNQSDPIGSCRSVRMHSKSTASPAADTRRTYEFAFGPRVIEAKRSVVNFALAV